jgi:acetyl esterase
MIALDPAMAAILAESSTIPAVDLLSLPIDEARAAYEKRWSPWNTAPPAMVEEREIRFAGPDGDLRASYRRPSADAEGLILYLHGGGWMFGSPESHEYLIRRLALEANAGILALDYRLAPEHPFPAPLSDVLAALSAVEEGQLPVCPRGALAIAGDSAGAALALSAMIHRHRVGATPVAGAALFYGCYAPDFDTDSYARFGDGTFGLSRARMEVFWRNYLGHAPTGSEGIATPGWADLDGPLPPVYLHGAGLDVLLDDTLALARRLTSVGGRLQLDITPGVIHGHLQMVSRLPQAREVLASAGRFLRQALRAGVPNPDTTAR